MDAPPADLPNAPEDVDASEHTDQGAEPDEEVWLCRRCRAEISAPSAVCSVGGAPAVQAFANPAGFVYEVVTVAHAVGAQPVGAPETHFTWFDGYAWQVAACAACGLHLGWLWTGAGPPTRFFGLIRDRLVAS